MGHASFDAALKRRDRALAVAAVEIPGALSDHGNLRAVLAEWILSHRLSLRVQHADVSHQHRARHRLRNVETIVGGATDCDIGAGAAGARLDARDHLAIRCEYEDMAKRGVGDEETSGAVHGHAVGAAWAEHGAEAADL